MTTSRKLFTIQLAFLLALPSLYSSVLLAHGDEASSQDHAYDDAYWAEQARLRETKIPYLIDHLQESFSGQLHRLSYSLLSELVSPANANINDPAVGGQWGAVKTVPFAFASAANLPDGRILIWGANNKKSFTGGAFTYASIWDPVSNQLTNANHPTHSLFCGMPVMLEDGRVFVSGGDKSSSTVGSVKMTSTFNYQTQSWTRVQNMNIGRWYPGTVAMPNGKVFTSVGDPGSQYPELWSQSTGWSYLNGASLKAAIIDQKKWSEIPKWLPHMTLAPNGQIFQSGHTVQMHYIDTAGNGKVTPVSIENDWNPAHTPNGAFFDEGKFLKSGGSLLTTYLNATSKAAVIDLNSSIPEFNPTSNMNYPRYFHNQVLLPNGEVMVVGGNTNGLSFDDNGSQLSPEIWNPVTKTWRVVAPHSVPRNYHSVSLLMTDGRIWAGGGGLCDCYADHPDFEVFTPPYLFNPDGTLATRPEITKAPNIVSYGQTIDVTASPEVSRFTMIKMSSTTHALNTDLRFLNVQFTAGFDGHYNLTLHTNRNVMTPGYWMLFALNQQGVPSLAKVINVSTSNSPVLTTVADQSTIVGADAALAMSATDPNGDALNYDAVGLPNGLVINPATGQISGIPSTIGSSRVVVSVSDGVNIASTGFVWTVVNDQSPPTSSTSYGSDSGSAFADVVNPDELLTGINIRSSGVLDAIQGVLNTGDLPKHGGNSGTLVSVSWPIDEYLVRIYGAYGISVGTITFETNTGRKLGPYGTASLLNNLYSFDFTVPVGREIVGFNGTEGSYINSIGGMHRVRQLRNQPPVVNSIINQLNKVGHDIELAVIASDSDSDVINYSATGLPPGLVINVNTGVISGTTTQAGSFDVIVKVKDTKGGVSAINFNWVVSDSVITINPITTTPQVVGNTVNFTASAANGINPRYKWSFGDGTPETEYSTTADISHTYTTPGLYVVKLSVIDDLGASNYNVFTQAIHLPHTVKHPNASTNITVDSENRLWVVNQDNDTVSVFNASNVKLGEVAVGKAPRSIAQAPDGRLWVTNKYSASLSVIDPQSLEVVQAITLPFASQPFGIVFAPDNSAAYVALEAIGKLIKLNPDSGAQLASLDIGANPRHLSVNADSSKILVSRFISPPMPGEASTVIDVSANGGEVIVVDVTPTTMTVNKTIVLQHSNLQDDTTRGAGIPNYLAMPVISPDGLSAWVPSKQDNIKRGMLRSGYNLNFQNSVRAIASKINLNTLSEVHSERIDFDNSGIGSAAIFDHTGNYLFVALESTQEVVIVDAYASTVVHRIAVGMAPDGLALSTDGKKVYVNNFMGRTVSVIDISGLLSWGDPQPPVIGQFNASSQEKLPPNILKGKQLFYDAKDLRLARDGYLSCAVCHNDGGHDGRVWDLTGFGEGLRNTIDLRGRSGTGHGILHWSGNFDEIQDFEGQIRSLAGGLGLMSDADFSATSDSLGPIKAGKSDDLDALAAYVASLSRFADSPERNVDGTLTAEALAGKALFVSAGCAQCHGGEGFTDSPAGVPHNVGTIKATSGKRLGGTLSALDSPTLRDVWHTAPYLHDGSAVTLNAAIKAHNNVTLADPEITKVAAYVRQIGSSEPPLDILPPTVTVTYPAANAEVSEENVIVSADASDNDGVAGVQFQLDGSNLGVEDTTAPYSTTWDTTEVANGTHTLTAIARDSSGNLATSASVTVVVNNSVAVMLPDVVVTSLTYNNGVFTSTIKNQGTIATPTGVAIGVGYLVDGVEQTWGASPVDLAAGQSVVINTNGGAYTIPEGVHTITADVDDVNRFAEANETNNVLSQTITVGGSDVTPPTVAITTPAADSTVSGEVIDVTATASDNVAVAGVQFQLDGSNLGAEDTSMPYSTTWNSTVAPNGSHTLTAIARDTAGNVANSTAVTVTVTNNIPSPLPDVVVTDLVYSNGVYTSTIKNQGSASTPVGVYIGVGYSVNGNYKTYGTIRGPLAAGASVTIGTNGGAFVLASGTHTVSAKVDDVNRFAELDETNNNLSQTLTIDANDTVSPTVVISSPLAGSTVTGTSVLVTANASDNVVVAGVQFKLDGVNLGAEDTIFPYSVSLNTTDFTDGTHVLTAVARDAAGNTAASSTVDINVDNTVVVVLPDVAVTDFTYSNGVFTTTIKNQGTAATPAGVYIGVGYSVDGVYKTYGAVKGPLAAGASITIGTNGGAYTIPSGDHTISAHVDDVNRFAELNETNNKLTQSLMVP